MTPNRKSLEEIYRNGLGLLAIPDDEGGVMPSAPAVPRSSAPPPASSQPAPTATPTPEAPANQPPAKKRRLRKRAN